MDKVHFHAKDFGVGVNKNMLDKQDKKDIKEIFDDSFDKIAAGLLKPSFDQVGIDIKRLEKDIKKMDETKPSIEQMNFRFDRMEQKMEQYAIEPSIKRDKKLNEKIDVVAKKLCAKKIFSDKDTEDIMRITPFSVGV
ncbi:MAG: hypothetical protein ABIJ91_01905 [Candidatus Kuenenbacteria bacterium]